MYGGDLPMKPHQTRFHLSFLPEPPQWSDETERNREQTEAWRLNLFEWCVLLSEVDELIQEVTRTDVRET